MSFALSYKKDNEKSTLFDFGWRSIGILIAPDKGSETLLKLREGFNDWKESAVDQLKGIVDQGKDIIGKGKDAVADVKTGAGEAMHEW